MLRLVQNALTAFKSGLVIALLISQEERILGMPSLVEFMKRNTTSTGGVLIIAIIAGAMWFYHYWVDFAIVSNLALETSYIVFHLAPVPLGALFYIFALRKRDVWTVTYVSSALMFFFMGLSHFVSVLPSLGLDLRTVTILALVLMLCVGFSVGIATTSVELLVIYTMHRTETRGTLNGLGYMFVGTILLIGIFVSTAWSLGAPVFYLVIVISILFIGRITPEEETSKFPPANNISTRHIAASKELVPAYITSLFTGFFFTATYYAIQAFLSVQLTWIAVSPQVWVSLGIFIPMLLISVPAGVLLDRLGRKGMVIVGANLQGLALVLLMILPESVLTEAFVTFIIFPVLAAGVLYSVFLAIVYLTEVGPEFGRRVYQGLTVALFGLGMTLGLLVTDLLLRASQQTSAQILVLPILMLFLYFTYTLVVAQLRETLPDKAEREWHQQIHELLVIVQGGLPLLQHRFEHGRIEVDSMLTSGALSGIDDLLSEITKQSDRLKVIQQENFSILMEHSGKVTVALLADKDLPVLRERIQLFLAEFMAFFGDLVEEWTGEPVVFSPAKRLVKKLFTTEST